jgi:ATP-binding cassette, subfamily B, bacterial HlyB/CyaB
MRHRDYQFTTEPFLWALGSLCQLHKIPFDAKLLLQQITPPYNIAGLLNAGQQLGLKIQTQAAAVRELAELPLPCIAVVQHSSDQHDEEIPPPANTKIEPTLDESVECWRRACKA